MRTWLMAMAVGVTMMVGAASAAPREAAVQGLYSGRCGGSGQQPCEGRLVALGGDQYALLMRCKDGGKVTQIELHGAADGARVTLEGQGADRAWTAVWTAGEVRGKGGADTTFSLKRVEPHPAALGKAPPKGAVVLLDGKNFEEMQRAGGQQWYVGPMERDGWAVWEVPIRTIVAKQPTIWPSDQTVIPHGWALGKDRHRVDTVLGIGPDGSLQVPRQGMQSKQRFEGSFDLHVEFKCPLRSGARSQARGNSGVFLPCGTEVQVLDSFGMATYKGGGCGGLYRWKDPDTMAPIQSLEGKPEHLFNLTSLPPETWQVYDVQYRVRKGPGGKPAGYLTVVQNDVRIHDNVKLQKPPRAASFSFQDHGNPVRYRNIWVLPVAGE